MNKLTLIVLIALLTGCSTAQPTQNQEAQEAMANCIEDRTSSMFNSNVDPDTAVRSAIEFCEAYYSNE